MKRAFVYFALLILSIYHLNAQEKLLRSTNIPRPLDNIFKQQVDYKNPGKSGANVFWNFGQLNAIDKKYSIHYRKPGVTTDTIIGTEHNTSYYYLSHGDSLMLSGYENQTTKMDYEKPELLLHFPVVYGDSINSYYFGTGKYCGKLDMMACGSSKSVVDAYGMLILPDGDTLRHVMRIHTVKLISERIQPTHKQDTLQVDSSYVKSLPSADIQLRLDRDSFVLFVDTYKWYAVGYRYPIFETVTTGNLRDKGNTTYFSTAFYYPPTNHDYLASDEENNKLREKLAQEDLKNRGNGKHKDSHNPMQDDLNFRYNFYPNPVNTSLTFEYYISKDAEVSYDLYNLSGSLVYSTKSETQQRGAHEQTIDMSQLAEGTYILRIRVNQTNYSEKIIKK